MIGEKVLDVFAVRTLRACQVPYGKNQGLEVDIPNILYENPIVMP